MQLELDDIQNVIKFTKVNIDTLNQRFCKIKPGMNFSLLGKTIFIEFHAFFQHRKFIWKNMRT